jgi:hypothetical protein
MPQIYQIADMTYKQSQICQIHYIIQCFHFIHVYESIPVHSKANKSPIYTNPSLQDQISDPALFRAKQVVD